MTNDALQFADDLNPSTVTDRYWLHAERRMDDYPASTQNCGKWLVFVPIAMVDDVWRSIKRATEDGKLGSAAKVATAMPNRNATDSLTKVICVYTYD